MPYLAQLAVMIEVDDSAAAHDHALRVRLEFEQRLASLLSFQRRMFVDEGVDRAEDLRGRALHEYCTIRHGIIRLTAMTYVILDALRGE